MRLVAARQGKKSVMRYEDTRNWQRGVMSRPLFRFVVEAGPGLVRKGPPAYAGGSDSVVESET